jgi:enamine deaminase RidA (YjgF/YER057c/UK114 family)
MARVMVFNNPATMAAPGGHYRHAVAANGFVFVSGQLPIALETQA